MRAKKDIFQNEIENQKEAQRRQAELEHKLENAENEKVRQKLIEDHMRALDAEKKRRQMLEDNTRAVGQQLSALERKKRQAAIDAKKAYKTGLETKGDYVAYNDYLDCMKMYPLKKLRPKGYKRNKKK